MLLVDFVVVHQIHHCGLACQALWEHNLGGYWRDFRCNLVHLHHGSWAAPHRIVATLEYRNVFMVFLKGFYITYLLKSFLKGHVLN
jgi:hypothetical protein